jgi:hypothetical protein
VSPLAGFSAIVGDNALSLGGGFGGVEQHGISIVPSLHTSARAGLRSNT